jgi:hypothetical protein
MNRRLKLLAALTLSLAIFSTGCIGHFGLSGKVRQFNLEQSEDRWGREILFVILYVIPVYPFAGFADIILFNSIEFWTGENPINGKPSVTPISDNRTFESEDGTLLSMTLREDRSIDVEAVGVAGDRHFVNLVQMGDGVAARDRSNAVIATSPGAESRDLAMWSAQPGSMSEHYIR